MEGRQERHEQRGTLAARQRAERRLAELGVQLVPEIETPAQLMAFLREDMSRSVAVLQAAGVRPE